MGWARTPNVKALSRCTLIVEGGGKEANPRTVRRKVARCPLTRPQISFYYPRLGIRVIISKQYSDLEEEEEALND